MKKIKNARADFNDKRRVSSGGSPLSFTLSHLLQHGKKCRFAVTKIVTD